MFWETKSFSKSPPERYSHSANVVGQTVVFIGGEVRSAKRFKDVYLLDSSMFFLNALRSQISTSGPNSLTRRHGRLLLLFFIWHTASDSSITLFARVAQP
jgi:hypothetical protein